MKKLYRLVYLTLSFFAINQLNLFNFKAIRNIILENKFLFIRTKFTKLTLDQAKQFYKVHESKLNFMIFLI